MIYLLRSPAWNKERGYFQILKIGYTSCEKGYSRREGNYKSHNPTSEMLIKIPGFGEDVEVGLHEKFKTHRFQGNEWYEFVPEIIDFFKDPDLYTNLRELGREGQAIISRRYWKRKENLYNYLLSTISPPSISMPEEISTKEEWLEKVIKERGADVGILVEERIKNYYDLDVLMQEVIEDIANLKTLQKRAERLEQYIQAALEEESEYLLTSNIIDEETIKEYEKRI